MRQVMVRYRVKPDRVAENEALVRAVYAQLHDVAPAGFHYATFKLEDGVTFVHLATTEREDGTTPLSDLPAFAAFQRDVRDRCDEAPVVSEVREVGSYRAG